MSAFNRDGKVVAVGDFVSIIGIISSISGSDSNATIVVQPELSTSTFNASPSDVNTIGGTACGAASGNKPAAGAQCTVRGYVTAVSGSGNTAILTVTLAGSGNSISGLIPAGSCHSTSQA